MENSELQTKIMNLGKLFVKELDLESSVDTFSRWMAHYIAENMTVAENSTGKKKQIAEKNCFDVILKLWEHRWTVPQENRPFKDFEPILRLLEQINPDNDHDYYHRVILNRLYPELENNIPINSSWINVSKEIDRVARIWIEFCINKMVAEIDAQKTLKWIEYSKQMPKSEDVKLISILTNNRSDEVNGEDGLKEYEIKRVEKRINELEKFKELNELILSSYKRELENVKKNI